MNRSKIIEYFENQAKTGIWGSLYDLRNPESYPFIARLTKSVKLMMPLEGKSVLDLGCGTGILIPIASENKCTYTGLDVSEEMMQSIRQQFPNLIAENKVTLITGEFDQSAIPGNTDIIIGMGFIEYFDHAEAVIQRLSQHLAKDGKLILTFPNFQSLDYFAVVLSGFFRGILRLISGKSTAKPPRKLWTVKNATRLFANAGLTNLEVEHYNTNIFVYPFTRISRRFCNFFARLFEDSFLSRYSFFSTGFIISGKKN